MKRIFASIGLFFLYTQAIATNLQSGVDRIINQIDPKINMGIQVVDLNTGERLYQRHPSQTFIPASNMKLFSEAAAVLALGPDYRFQNQLSTDASSIDNGVLNGSLYVHLPGDPSFTQRQLDILLSQLAHWDVKRIHGNVVIISSHSSVDAYAPGWNPKDLSFSYGAPLAPLVLDENRLTVTVNPACRVGEPAVIEYNAPRHGLTLDNLVKTADNSKRCGVSIKLDTDNHLQLRGCVKSGQWSMIQRIPIHNPLRYAEDLIKNRLAHLNIGLDGNVILGAYPPKATLLLATQQSKPITQLMADTLKPSDNLYADSLYLKTAAKLNGTPLNWSGAQPVIKKFLQQQTGINLQSAVMIDGSGLSRQDLLTAEQTVSLLRFLYVHFPITYEYIAALPISGRDGTLQRRLRAPSQQGFIRAKTGSMTGVVSLSGYLYTANAHTLAFAIFINTRPGTSPNISGRYRSLVDALCDYFLKQKPDNRFVSGIANPHGHTAFEQQPTLTDRQRYQQAKWRALEASLKKALQGQPVSIIFRHHQLVLSDNGADLNKIWSTLKTLNQKYPFAVALRAQSTPITQSQTPRLMLIKDTKHHKSVRTWVIQDVV